MTRGWGRKWGHGHGRSRAPRPDMSRSGVQKSGKAVINATKKILPNVKLVQAIASETSSGSQLRPSDLGKTIRIGGKSIRDKGEPQTRGTVCQLMNLSSHGQIYFLTIAMLQMDLLCPRVLHQTNVTKPLPDGIVVCAHDGGVSHQVVTYDWKPEFCEKFQRRVSVSRLRILSNILNNLEGEGGLDKLISPKILLKQLIIRKRFFNYARIVIENL
ncbi:hypothetical protein KY289_036711 [Solanum tuberosum]|nr:hypothetical protein KY289_036711 [Solanum tuberosum]